MKAVVTPRLSSIFSRLALATGVSLVCLLGNAPAVHAADEPLQVLQQFVQQTRHATGRFEQQLDGSSGRSPERSTGHFAFERPGRFRWVYEAPYPQELVSDGTRIWSWDADLNQASVRDLGDALGSTPAAILAGDGVLERDFEVSEGGMVDGLRWIQATPKQAESSFALVRLGFVADKLVRMEMQDNFGQNSVIHFTEFDVTKPVDSKQFSFTPPPGADVIGAE